METCKSRMRMLQWLVAWFPKAGVISVLKHVVSYEGRRGRAMLMKSTEWHFTNPSHSFVPQGIILTCENPCTEMEYLQRCHFPIWLHILWEASVHGEEGLGWWCSWTPWTDALGFVHSSDSNAIKIILLWYVVISMASIDLGISSVEHLRESFQE